ncbi:MAG: translation initiation factor IF-2 subunit gamma [Candidatus Diapherotrites archaeon]|nr:translation initiation factor IF-2 subunit gamma [Candidatus Diapherotrites archaeon]
MSVKKKPLLKKPSEKKPAVAEAQPEKPKDAKAVHAKAEALKAAAKPLASDVSSKPKDAKPKQAFAEQAVVNIGMVGHVDHGKTTLTSKLTGKWTDTHSEELKRGISIRLGYADAVFYRCPECKGSEAFGSSPVCQNCNSTAQKLRKVSFVDAPGHETLMTTMLSGAALMQGAVLVIAANEPCPQPRTVEHLMALKIAGIESIVVAQNKADLVSREQALAHYTAIKKFLQENGFAGSPVIPTSANFGVNVDLLIEAIEECIKTPSFDSGKPVKLFCARSFDINKPGTKIHDLKGGVLGGSVMQGTLRLNDQIEISPGLESKPILTSVVSLGVSGGALEEARPGGLIAIGTTLDPSITQNDSMRGQVVSKPGSMPSPTTSLRLNVVPLERLLVDGSHGVKVNDLVVITVGTMTAVGNVVKENKKSFFDVALKNEVVIEPGQKVAISKRESGQWRLVAYGISG